MSDTKEIIEKLYTNISQDKHIFNNKFYLNINTNFKPVVKKNNIDGKLITFIMPLKNRSDRALLSIDSIVNKKNLKYCDFIIVEDICDNKLNLPNEFIGDITHYIVDTNDKWNRSKLLNYGIKRTNTPLCLMWDADFIFPITFMENIKEYFNNIDFNKNYFAIPSFETHNTSIFGSVYKSGDPYGNLWIYPTEHLKKIRGFNEKMKNHGFEERELQLKFKKVLDIDEIYTFNFNKNIMVFHLSHKDNIRGKSGVNENRKFLNNILLNEIWGESKLIEVK